MNRYVCTQNRILLTNKMQQVTDTCRLILKILSWVKKANMHTKEDAYFHLYKVLEKETNL